MVSRGFPSREAAIGVTSTLLGRNIVQLSGYGFYPRYGSIAGKSRRAVYD